MIDGLTSLMAKFVPMLVVIYFLELTGFLRPVVDFVLSLFGGD